MLPRLLRVEPGPDESPLADMYDTRFVPLEDVISAHLDHLFPGMEVREHFTFRVTRNEDLEVEEDDAENLLTALERELTRRRFGPPVRLEVEEDMDAHVLDLLVRELGVAGSEVYRLPAPLDLRALNVIADLERSDLHFEPVRRAHQPRPRARPRAPRPATSSRRSASRTSCSSTPTTRSRRRCRRSSSRPPSTRGCWRSSRRSTARAATARSSTPSSTPPRPASRCSRVVEIKARFDEQNNISWARKLEHAGVHVVYGIVGLKTHAKLCLVIRQEAEGLRRYCHVGTGNYNPKTARLYEDLGLLTVDEQVGEDLTRLFNQLSGMAPRSRFKRLLVAPRSVRSGLIDLIDAEIEHEQREPGSGHIAWKVNSIVDEQLIDALYRASQAGVRVQLWVRGICALRPGVEGLSENIEVRSHPRPLPRALAHLPVRRRAATRRSTSAAPT